MSSVVIRSPGPTRRNLNTCLLRESPVAPLSPPDPHAAYRIAVAAERARPSGVESLVGHRLYWVCGDVVGACDLIAGEDRFLVLGRHTHADVVLDRDPAVSLRHLLLRSVSLADAPPMLSVLDLSSELAFRLVDGSLQHAIVASGPTVFTVGAYAVVALPTGVPPLELPPPQIVPVGSAPDFARHPYRAPPSVATQSRVLRDSVVNLMPRLLDLAVALPTGAMGSRVPAVGAAGAVELEVRSPRGRAFVTLSQEQLTQGVLLGRAPRCAAFGTLLSTTTSRVHALLLETRTGLAAFDTASTHGLFDAAGARRRVLPLVAPVERLHMGSSEVEVVIRRV